MVSLLPLAVNVDQGLNHTQHIAIKIQRNICKKRAGPRGVVYEGGGALKTRDLNRRRKQRRGKGLRGGFEPPLIKIFVSKNAFQTI